MFHCPDCGSHTRIPYFDSLFEVCWACQPCGKYPHQQRVEAGKLDANGAKAKAIFKELDKDSSGSLDKAEFKIWFDSLHGVFDPNGSPEKKSGENAMPELAGYAAQLFDKIDADKNGSISIQEFVDYFGAEGDSDSDSERRGSHAETSHQSATQHVRPLHAKSMRPKRTTFTQCVPCLETVLLLK
eukprot:UN0870